MRTLRDSMNGQIEVTNMARYQVDLWAHYLDNKGELTNPLFSRKDIVKNYSLFGAFDEHVKLWMKQEKVTLESIVALEIRNWDMCQNNTLRYYPIDYNVPAINEHDMHLKREFLIRYVGHIKDGLCTKVRANNIFEGLSIFCQHYQIKFDPNEYPDRYDNFAIWEENWRIS